MAQETLGRPWGELRTVAALPYGAPRALGLRAQKGVPAGSSGTPGAWQQRAVKLVGELAFDLADFAGLGIVAQRSGQLLIRHALAVALLLAPAASQQLLMLGGELEDAGTWLHPPYALSHVPAQEQPQQELVQSQLLACTCRMLDTSVKRGKSVKGTPRATAPCHTLVSTTELGLVGSDLLFQLLQKLRKDNQVQDQPR